MEFNAAHLPIQSPTAQLVVVEHDDVRVLAPALTAAHVDDACARLVAAQRALVTMPTSRIIGAISGAATLLQQDATLPHLLAACSGTSLQMARLVLHRMTGDWQAASLQALVDAEFGGARALDGFAARTGSKRFHVHAPALGLHVFSGNVAGVGVTSIIRSLLVRTAVLGKSAAGEPVLAPAFARALDEVDAEIGSCAGVTWWRGGDEELESAALQHAGIVVHYGSAQAIAGLRARTPAHVRFVEHGPRVSCALVHAPAPPHAARDLALAVATFDQQGCVSPQAAYVIGTQEEAHAFAASVAAELDALQVELPRGRIDAAEAAAVRELRATAEFRSIAGSAVQLWAGDSLSYTVVLDDDVAFTGSCLNRTLIVKHAPTLDDVIDALGAVRAWLQTVGIAGFDDVDDVALRLARAGATRITSIPSMPWPPMTWQHDGRGPLRELVSMVDLEEQT